MAVRTGYKQTDLGAIPADWEVKRCKEACVKIQDGTHFSPTIRGNDYLYVTSKNIRFGYFDISTADRIDANQHEAIYKRCDVRHGDLLLTKDGANTGNAAINYLDEQFSLLSSVAFLRFDEERNSANYFLQQVLSSSGQQQIKEAMSGNAITRLTLAKINNLKFPAPPFPEQRAIATALSDVDALLSKLNALIAKKRDLKVATMQQLLTGQTRLPGFSGDWGVRTIKSLVQTPVTDGPHMTPRFQQTGIPFLSVNNLVGNKIDLSDLRFISQQDHEEFSKKCKPQKGDLLLGKAASVGKIAIVDTDVEFNIWSPIALIRIGFENEPRFIYYKFQSASLSRQIALLTNSSSQGNIGMGDIEKLEVQLPPRVEQTAIATVLFDMDAELAALEARRDKTRALKQGMMQELLTGRIRLV